MVFKKRKFYIESLENLFKKMKNNLVDVINSYSVSDVLYGFLFNQQELKFSRNDFEFKYFVSYGLVSESEYRSWVRESKSFNVLK